MPSPFRRRSRRSSSATLRSRAAVHLGGGARLPARRRRAPDDAQPRPGRMHGDRGRLRPRARALTHRARRGARRPPTARAADRAEAVQQEPRAARGGGAGDVAAELGDPLPVQPPGRPQVGGRAAAPREHGAQVDHHTDGAGLPPELGLRPPVRIPLRLPGCATPPARRRRRHPRSAPPTRSSRSFPRPSHRVSPHAPPQARAAHTKRCKSRTPTSSSSRRWAAR